MTQPRIRITMKSRVVWEGAKIEKQIERRSEKALYQFGAYTRRRIRRLMNKSAKRGHSEPGQPPRKITEVLRASVRYDVDTANDDVTILLPQQFERSTADVPAVLEFGGTERLRLGVLFGEPADKDAVAFPLQEFQSLDSETQRELGRSKAGKFRKRQLIHNQKFPAVEVNYEPRPALLPAFDEMIEKHGPGGPRDLWGDLV